MHKHKEKDEGWGAVFGGEENRMDIVDGSCVRREGGDQSKGCLYVASQPSLECGRADSREESV